MIGSLVRKELRALGPDLALVLAVYLLLPLGAYGVAGKWIDHLDFHDLADFEDFTIFNFFLAFSIASTILVREVDQGTAIFLDSLPVHRGQVFLAKLACAWALLAAGPITATMLGLVANHASRCSLDRGLPAAMVVIPAALCVLQLVTFFGLGLALAYVRRFAWLIAGMLFFVQSRLEGRYPSMKYLDPDALVNLVWVGQEPRVPWMPVAVHVAETALFSAMALGLFLDREARVAVALTRFGDHLVGRLVLGATGIGVLALWGAVVLDVAQHGAEDAVAELNPSRVITGAYEITFRDEKEAQAAFVAAHAEDVHAWVVARLGAEPRGTIVVDGTATTRGDHIAGQAMGKSMIRVDLTIDPGPDLLATLAHETVHVYADALSEHRLTELHDSTRFFNEGYAEYLETAFRGGPESWLEAAAIVDLHDLDLGDLVQNDELVSRLDPSLVYPVGASFVAALVDLHGVEAPARVLRAMGREGVSHDLEGIELWSDTLRAAGYDLDELAGYWRGWMDRLAQRWRTEIDALPPLGGDAEVRPRGDVQVRFLLDDAPGVVCRFRVPGDAEMGRFVAGTVKDGGCRLDDDALPAGPVEFQVGAPLEGVERVIWGEWYLVDRAVTAGPWGCAGG